MLIEKNTEKIKMVNTNARGCLFYTKKTDCELFFIFFPNHTKFIESS